MSEAEETGMGAGEFSTQARELGKTQGADPKERAVVTKLAKGLLAAAQKSNIRSGTVGALLQKVFQEIERMQGAPKKGEEEQLQEMDLFGKQGQARAQHLQQKLTAITAEAVQIMKEIARDPNVAGMNVQLQHKLLNFIRDNERLFARSDADYARTGEDTYREPMKEMLGGQSPPRGMTRAANLPQSESELYPYRNYAKEANLEGTWNQNNGTIVLTVGGEPYVWIPKPDPRADRTYPYESVMDEIESKGFRRDGNKPVPYSNF